MKPLKLIEIDKNEWMFDWPRESDKATDVFFEGMEYFDEGNSGKVRQLFEKALLIYPDHIDVLHHLAIISKEPKSSELLERALDIGRKTFSKDFNEKGKLEWGWTENRPLLMAYYAKGLKLLEKGKTKEAIKYFNQLIAWNLNDNQGVRDILAEIYVGDKQWDKIIDLSELYPGDAMPALMHSKALAMYKKGDIEKATEELKDCIRSLPKCGKVLLEKNPKKPKQTMEGYITVGGEDQAYGFWVLQGKAWKDKDVQEWVKSVIGGNQ